METGVTVRAPRRAKLEPVGVAADALRQLKFNFGATGLGLRQGVTATYAEWEACGDWLRAVDGAVQWWVGDWLRLGEELFGEEHAQALDMEAGWDQRSLDQMRWVAERVAPAARRADLSWAHHREVAAVDDSARQREWLARAAAGDGEGRWPVDRLRREVQAAKRLAAGQEPAAPVLWVAVEARDEADAERLRAQFEAEGRKVKVR